MINLKLQNMNNPSDTDIPFPKTETFRSPMGKHAAILREAVKIDDKKNPGNLMIRLIWELTNIKSDRFIYKVGKSYPLERNTSEELFADLESWFGDDLKRFEVEGVLRLKNLIGERADLFLTHVHNPNYDAPYVHVKEIHPEGTGRQIE